MVNKIVVDLCYSFFSGLLGLSAAENSVYASGPYLFPVDSSGGRNGFLSSATTAGLWSFLQSVFSVFDLILGL